MELREYRKATRCEQRGRLRACRRGLAGQCQYCARGFCGEHGERFGEGEEVCQRSRCQAKKADLARHVAFRAEARERNAAGECGMPGCASAEATDCQRCGPSYCVAHLQETIGTVMHQGEPGSDVFRLCVHCVERAAIWERA